MPFRREIDEARVMRGQEISKSEGQISRLDGHTYQVKSQAGNGLYTVVKGSRDWRCSCPDHIYREVKCKHIWAVEFSLRLREKVKENLILEPVATDTCMFCKSNLIFKDGLRHNKFGDLQKWNCRACGRYFTVNIGFERMKHNPQGITAAMQLYFSGESLRNTARSLRLMGIQVSYQTVWNWIDKYTALMAKYLNQITPQVSDTWRADELYMKFHGNMKYVFAMMDDETRFWIAQEVADTKDTHDAQHLFQMAKERAGKKPQVLITDGLRSYRDAWLKEFRTNKQSDSTVHIRQITIAGQHNNNKMERMNGEIRDREKVTRNLKKPDSPILTGLQIYHNYVRPHMGLDGKTPADLAGIQVEGEDKWMTLIQNASQPTKLDNDKNSKEPTTT
ncbi:MAG: DDE-type integrase/transposase/recombinase [Candidatus Bathyarchaeia archaeon]